MKRQVVSVGLVAMVAVVAVVAGCGLDLPEGRVSSAVELRVHSWTPEHLQGTATLGDSVLRFESLAARGDGALVTFDFGDAVVEYGVIAADDLFWIDGRGAALSQADVNLLRQLLPLLEAQLPAEARRSAAEHMLGAGAAHLGSGTPGYVITRQSGSAGLAAAPITYGLANDGVSCIKRYSTVTARYDWPGASFTSSVTTGGSCGSLGYCGDCFFTTGTWTKDCLEHDTCLWKAHSLGLSALDADPGDFFCGDEWLEAADDFLLGHNWPYNCRG